MASIKVGSYSVGVIRRTSEMITRFVTCIPEASQGGGLDSFMIYFVPDHDSVGYEDGANVVGFLPPEDFSDVYHVLQTERPVFINWSTKGDSKNLDYISVGTRQEPPGEGFQDLSS